MSTLNQDHKRDSEKKLQENEQTHEQTSIKNYPLCPRCDLLQIRKPASIICRSCEADKLNTATYCFCATCFGDVHKNFKETKRQLKVPVDEHQTHDIYIPEQYCTLSDVLVKNEKQKRDNLEKILKISQGNVDLLDKLVEKPEFKNRFKKEISEAYEKTKKGVQKSKILIVGRTSSGKTSLINWLLGKKLGVTQDGKGTVYRSHFMFQKFDTDDEIVVETLYDKEGQLVKEFKKSNDESMSDVYLKRELYLKSLIVPNEKEMKLSPRNTVIATSHIYSDSPILEYTEIIDTPGISKDAKEKEIDAKTLEIAKDASIVICMMPNIVEEQDYVNLSKYIEQVGGKLLVVFNWIDNRMEIDKWTFDQVKQEKLTRLKERFPIPFGSSSENVRFVSLKACIEPNPVFLNNKLYDELATDLSKKICSVILSANDELFDKVVQQLLDSYTDFIDMFLSKDDFLRKIEYTHKLELNALETIIKRAEAFRTKFEKAMREELKKEDVLLEGIKNLSPSLTPYNERENIDKILDILVRKLISGDNCKAVCEELMKTCSTDYQTLSEVSRTIKGEIPGAYRGASAFGWGVGGAAAFGTMLLISPLSFLIVSSVTGKSDFLGDTVAKKTASIAGITIAGILLWPLFALLSPIAAIVGGVLAAKVFYKEKVESEEKDPNFQLKRLFSMLTPDMLTDKVLELCVAPSRERIVVAKTKYDERKLLTESIPSKQIVDQIRKEFKDSWLKVEQILFGYILSNRDTNSGAKLQLEESLGEGTSARVYKETINGNVYAVKLFKEKKSVDVLYDEMFAKRVCHRNIVNTYYVGKLESQAYPCIVMECLEFPCDKIDKVDWSEFSPEIKVNLFIQLAGCLDFLHGQGILHRDIKPKNLGLVKNSEQRIKDDPNDVYTIKYLDFGTSKQICIERGTLGVVGDALFLHPVLYTEYKKRIQQAEFSDQEYTPIGYKVEHDLFSLGATFAMMWENCIGDRTKEIQCVDRSNSSRHVKNIENHKDFKGIDVVKAIIYDLCSTQTISTKKEPSIPKTQDIIDKLTKIYPTPQKESKSESKV